MVYVGFHSWFKSSTNIKLSSDAVVVRLTYECITHFVSLTDFDKKYIDNLPVIYKNTVSWIAKYPSNWIALELEIQGANFSLILVLEFDCYLCCFPLLRCHWKEYERDKHYVYGSPVEFKIECDDYLNLKDEDSLTCPLHKRKISYQEGHKLVLKLK